MINALTIDQGHLRTNGLDMQQENYDKFHYWNKDHALKFGIYEAILIQNFVIDTILFHRDKGIHFHEGKTWCYGSVNDLTKRFPYFTTKQIRNTLDKLVEKNVLIKSNFNKRAHDRTCWYAFVDEAKFLGSNIKQEGQK